MVAVCVGIRHVVATFVGTTSKLARVVGGCLDLFCGFDAGSCGGSTEIGLLSKQQYHDHVLCHRLVVNRTASQLRWRSSRVAWHSRLARSGPHRTSQGFGRILKKVLKSWRVGAAMLGPLFVAALLTAQATGYLSNAIGGTHNIFRH